MRVRHRVSHGRRKGLHSAFNVTESSNLLNKAILCNIPYQWTSKEKAGIVHQWVTAKYTSSIIVYTRTMWIALLFWVRLCRDVAGGEQVTKCDISLIGAIHEAAGDVGVGISITPRQITERSQFHRLPPCLSWEHISCRLASLHRTPSSQKVESHPP